MSKYIIIILVGMTVSVSAKAANLPEIKPVHPITAIRQFGEGEGLSEWEVQTFMRIMECESTYNPLARNGQYRGLYQIGNWEYENYGFGDPFDVRDNTRSAINYYKVTGFNVWSCY